MPHAPLLTVFALMGLSPCLAQEDEPAHSITIQAGDLTVVIGDSSDHGAGREGYEGIWSLTHTLRAANVFRPIYAGVIAHRQPCTVVRVSDTAVEMRREGHPAVERFEVVPPHYIGYTVRFTAGGTTAGWNAASYMNAPEDPAIYLINSAGQWLRHYDPEHGHAASVLPEGMEPPVLQTVPDALYPHGTNSFADSLSDLRFDPHRALFYGHIEGGMVLIYMFERGSEVIPYMSPSGGGTDPETGRRCPAWDFRYRLSGLTPGEEVLLRQRLVYKPFVSRQDVLAEYAAWRESLGEEGAAAP
ncbi:MAG: hypothetical protein AB7Y46_02300 [Armatimonadota bacterium]